MSQRQNSHVAPRNERFILVLLFYLSIFNNFARDTFALRAAGRRSRLQGICPADLESKFLTKEGKCQYSGFVPVKGSCTAYIPCVSFGGDMMKPMKRTECPKSVGLVFDIDDLRCRPKADVSRCMQRICFPEEALMEDGLSLMTKKSVSSDTASESNESGNAEDVIVLTLDDSEGNTTMIFGNYTVSDDYISGSSSLYIKSFLMHSGSGTVLLAYFWISVHKLFA